MTYQPGRHFLQLPGPTNTPLPILAAMAKPVIDHRGPEFAALTLDVLERVKTVFGTDRPVITYPTSGSGAWEAALVNVLSPGDRVLMYETGHFAALWGKIAGRLGIAPEFIPGDWRRPVDAEAIGALLAEDKAHAIKAVAVVHNETSTGVMSDIPAVRRAMDQAGHPALLLVDNVSSVGAVDYRHDEWRVDVTVGASQKGLMLPPGIAFNVASEKAMAASRTATCARSYWDWEDMLAFNGKGFFPYTPNTNLLQGLKVALEMLHEEGLEQVYARHRRAAEATRRAAQAWGLELQGLDATTHSPMLTAVRMPEGHSADRLRSEILTRYNMSLGGGLGKVADKLFRIGHLGDFHDLMTTGALTGVEMGLKVAGVPHRPGGVDAAMTYLAGNAAPVG